MLLLVVNVVLLVLVESALSLRASMHHVRVVRREGTLGLGVVQGHLLCAIHLPLARLVLLVAILDGRLLHRRRQIRTGGTLLLLLLLLLLVVLLLQEAELLRDAVQLRADGLVRLSALLLDHAAQLLLLLLQQLREVRLGLLHLLRGLQVRQLRSHGLHLRGQMGRLRLQLSRRHGRRGDGRGGSGCSGGSCGSIRSRASSRR